LIDNSNLLLRCKKKCLNEKIKLKRFCKKCLNLEEKKENKKFRGGGKSDLLLSNSNIFNYNEIDNLIIFGYIIIYFFIFLQ